MLTVNQNIINFHLRCDCPFHFVIASFLGVLQGKLFTAKGLSSLQMLGRWQLAGPSASFW